MELVGFHGTTVKDASIILKEGFKCSDKTSWLGKGVYFFEDLKSVFDGYADAEKWCSIVKKLKSYAILRAIIKSDNVFDLVNDEHDRKRYKKIYEELYRIHLEKGYPAEAFKLYTVFNIIGESVDVIRCIVDGKKYNTIPRNYVTMIPQIQICVCNNTSTVICDIKKEKEVV